MGLRGGILLIAIRPAKGLGDESNAPVYEEITNRDAVDIAHNCASAQFTHPLASAVAER